MFQRIQSQIDNMDGYQIWSKWFGTVCPAPCSLPCCHLLLVDMSGNIIPPSCGRFAIRTSLWTLPSASPSEVLDKTTAQVAVAWKFVLSAIAGWSWTHRLVFPRPVFSIFLWGPEALRVLQLLVSVAWQMLARNGVETCKLLWDRHTPTIPYSFFCVFSSKCWCKVKVVFKMFWDVLNTAILRHFFRMCLGTQRTDGAARRSSQGSVVLRKVMWFRGAVDKALMELSATSNKASMNLWMVCWQLLLFVWGILRIPCVFLVTFG